MKKKITLIIPNFDDGGAQRFFANLINALDFNKFEIILIVFNINNSKFFKYIPKNIIIYDLNKKRVRYGLFKLYKLILKINPDLVFSTLTQINLPIAFFKIFFFKKIKFIAREANLVSLNLNRYKFKWVWVIMYKFLYKYFDTIVCISHTQANDLITNFHISEKKIKIIYNFVSPKTENRLKKSNLDSYFNDYDCTYFLAIGSLSIQKRFDKLVSSFNLIKNNNFKLYILGQGPLKDDLLVQIEKYGLGNKIRLLGYTDNVYEWLKKTDYFVISSDYEGLGTVIIESIYNQTPVLSFPIKGIASEILEDIKGCYYVKNNSIEDFARLLKERMNKKYKLNKTCIEKFSQKNIMLKYENLFLKDI